MNSHFSQSSRQGRLSTVAGEDALVLLRMDGVEELSGDFEWRVEALSDQPAIDIHSLLGTHATVEIGHADGTRAFDGIVCEAEAKGAFENGYRYDLVLRPWLYAAGLRRNMRIFHDKTVIDIVQEVLDAYAGLGNPHLDVQITGDYPVLEYTVQYGESDANFVRRQLERHGISWSWEHKAGNHTLILTDATFSLPQVPGGTRPYYGVGGYHRHEEEHFSRWSTGERITTGAVRLTEYNFKTPDAGQEVDHAGDATYANGDIESYDWPGDYLDQSEGTGVVSARLEAERGQAPRHCAEGDVVSLGAGWLVTLKGDEVPGATGRSFVCLKAQHRFRAQAYGSGDAGGDEAPYQGAYVLMPDDTPYRPERRTIAPRVQGPETAFVVGEGEIDCDEHGRILCRFHWDLDGVDTMRVRVSQNWASKGWGGMIIPRIGMEVIVEHLRGDPDKPIVTGCVFNGKNDAPYKLPEHKTRSTFRTDTHQGEGFNELRFEDQNGREEIYIHAQKDLVMHVRNNRAKNVMGSQIETVVGNHQSEVGKNSVQTVDGNLDVKVGLGSISSIISHATSLLASAGFELSGRLRTRAASLARARPPAVGAGAYRLTVAGSKTETVGVLSSEQVGATKASAVGGQRIDVTGGDHRYKVVGNAISQVGGATVIDSANGWHLTSGESSISVMPDGTIKISGNDIQINGTKRIAAKGGRIDLN